MSLKRDSVSSVCHMQTTRGCAGELSPNLWLSRISTRSTRGHIVETGGLVVVLLRHYIDIAHPLIISSRVCDCVNGMSNAARRTLPNELR